MRQGGTIAACLSLFGMVGCTTFPVIEAGVCGNAVWEPEAQEDCDTFIDRHETPGAVCRPPGVPGACHFDCQPQSDGSQASCPSDMGCAADGICRRPSGEFEAPLQLSSDVSSWVSTADFDGDGRLEVISAELADQVQQARFRLHYFDAESKLVETRVFPRITTRPVVANVNNDDQDDLVFSNFRIGMVPGRRDREWVPSTFSSYVVPDSGLRVVPVTSGLVGGAFALVALATLDGTRGLYVASDGDANLSYRAPLPRPLDDLAGQPLAADIVEGVASPCLELLLAYRGDSFFRLLDMCEIASDQASLLSWRAAPREQLVRLANGKQIDAGPISADIDGDGHLDVLVGSGGDAYVAHGDGERLEDTASPVMLSVLGSEAPTTLEMPLAAGDVTGDGVADFVLPSRILGSRKSPVDASVAYLTTFTNTAQPWSMALVVDLNGNQLLDVIAGTEGAPGLSFLSGTGGSFPVFSRRSTQGPLRLLATGDYDGDLIADVALIEGGPPHDPTDALAIAFGTRDQVPLNPVRIAELSGVQQLGSQRDQGLDDVFTASTEVVGGGSRAKFTLFNGDTERLPFAPYTLVDFSSGGSLASWNAIALQVGAFRAPGATDAVALGIRGLSDPWNQWLVPNVGSGEVPPQLLTGETPGDVFPSQYAAPQAGLSAQHAADADDGSLSVAGAAADLDGDGLDEALWLMPRGKDACALLIYDIDTNRQTAELKSRLDFDEPCATPELRAAPLREKGLSDLLLLLGDPARAPRRLVLLWNDGEGHFSSSKRTVVQGDEQADIAGFGVFPQPGAGLVFVTASALHVAMGLDAQREFTHVQILPGLHDARSVVVTDPNRDQVSDLVVADADGLWLVKADLR